MDMVMVTQGGPERTPRMDMVTVVTLKGPGREPVDDAWVMVVTQERPWGCLWVDVPWPTQNTALPCCQEGGALKAPGLHPAQTGWQGRWAGGGRLSAVTDAPSDLSAAGTQAPSPRRPASRGELPSPR